jgi:hypothetical protein
MKSTSQKGESSIAIREEKKDEKDSEVSDDRDRDLAGVDAGLGPVRFNPAPKAAP